LHLQQFDAAPTVDGQFFAVTLSTSIEAVEGKMFAHQGAAVVTDLQVRAVEANQPIG
jgi:hypothetical protein